MSWNLNFLIDFNVIDFELFEMFIVLWVWDIGGFEVWCVLFFVKCRMVGLFVFFD